MNNKKVARVIAIILALVMLLGILFVIIDFFTPTHAGANTSNTQAEINRLRNEKSELDRQRREIQSIINDIEFDRRTQVAQKAVLDDRILLTGLEIESINEMIDLYGVLILEKEQEVILAQIREDEQLAIYRARVRSMEENGAISYLNILFDSTSFSDLLARWETINDIMRADERLFQNLIVAREETQAAEEDLRLTRLELEEEKLTLEQRERELEEQIEQASEIIRQLEADLESSEALFAMVTAEANQIQNDINRKIEEQRREEEARRIAEANRVRGTGQFRWPVPTGGQVTSGFGVRMHPVFRVNRMHYGIDIAGAGAGHGANVIAADTGTVVISDFNSTYGHYIVINHGNGFTTLYAHLSSRLVRATQTVTQGQVIGRIGSTGISTGPHLHFEISQNGNRVNPVRFL